MSYNNNNNNTTNNKYKLAEQPGLSGIVSSSIGITQYIAFFIINKVISVLGIDTSGKDLNNLLDEINRVIEDPVTRQKFLKVMNSIAEILVILVDELSGPLKEATSIFIDLGQEASVKLAKTFVAAAIDALGVVPGLGEVVEGIKFFDDVAKQIQASINVFLKTFTLLTNVLGANLDSFNSIKTRIQGNVDQIQSQFEGINLPELPAMPNMPALPNMPSLPAMPNYQAPTPSIPTAPPMPRLPSAPSLPTAPSYQAPSYQQIGGIKNIKKNINKTSKRITKNLNMFYNRTYKTNKTHRINK
jgi:hypothetical protein